MKSILRVTQATVLAAFLLAITAYAQPPEQLKRASELWKQGIANYEGRRYDAAIANFDEYLKIRPDAAAGWFNRGISYFERAANAPLEKDYRQAVADISQAIKLDPKKADQFLMRGRAYQKLIVIDFKPSSAAAIADFTSAIMIDGKYAEAYSGRGQVFYETGQYDKALNDLNTAILFNKNDAVPYYYRGKVMGYQKKYAASRADIEKALSIYPSYDVAKIYLEYINEEERKSRQPIASKPPVAQKPATKPSPKNTPAVGQKPPVTTRPPVTATIADAREGYKVADDAEKARNFKLVIDAVTQSLPFIKMRSKGQPDDSFMTSVYLELLRKRARAYMALKQYANADADYETAAMDAMSNMNRHGQNANAELAKDRTGMGAGMILGSLENSYATIICDSSFTSVSEWIAAIDRDRPTDNSAKLRSAIVMGATRQVCAANYTTKGTFDRSKTIGSAGDRTKPLNEAIASYTKAINYMQVFREAYVQRAKAYRELGRIDLAIADEQKAATLKPN